MRTRWAWRLLTPSQCPPHYISCMLILHKIFLVTESGDSGVFLTSYMERSWTTIPATLPPPLFLLSNVFFLGSCQHIESLGNIYRLRVAVTTVCGWKASRRLTPWPPDTMTSQPQNETFLHLHPKKVKQSISRPPYDTLSKSSRNNHRPDFMDFIEGDGWGNHSCPYAERDVAGSVKNETLYQV